MKELLIKPFKNKSGMGGDNDEVTLMSMGVNWGVVAITLCIVVSCITMFVKLNKAVNKTTIGSIQNQNQSITANDQYKQNH